MREKKIAAPLAGIKVVELGQMITAPLAAMLLADMGASVIKIENPENGDLFRAFRGGLYSGHFMSYNRNKRSVTLNLRHGEGKAIALKLIAAADVLLENFRPDVMARLGLDGATLAAINPRLIHASITGFGCDGPYAGRPAYDTVGTALSGMGSLFYDPEDPQVAGPTISDNVTGMTACQGILAALYERSRAGKGSRVEVNMIEAAIAFMPDPFANYYQMGMEQDPCTRSSGSQSYALRCADGKLIAFHLSSPDKFWQGLLRATGRQDLGADPRFAGRMERMKHYQALRSELAKSFAEFPLAEWVTRLTAEDVPFAPVYSIPEVEHDPQVRHLGTFYEIAHPTQGSQKGIRPPVRFGGERGAVHSAAPVLGEHTDAVLAELGLAQEEVARLRAAGAV